MKELFERVVEYRERLKRKKTRIRVERFRERIKTKKVTKKAKVKGKSSRPACVKNKGEKVKAKRLKRRRRKRTAQQRKVTVLKDL